MNHDELDDLDRALMALPLEEPPASLHARILATTIYRPRPVIAQWEFWLVGTLAAIALWLCWSVASAPHAGERLVDAFTGGLERYGLTSMSTILWIAIGASAVLWVSQLSFPAARRIRVK